jgi:hypothetical protein
MLAGSPFSDYLVPGLFLFLVNGLATLGGGALAISGHRFAGRIAIILGGLLMVWIVTQVSSISLTSWIQPRYFAVGLLELLLGLFAAMDGSKFTCGAAEGEWTDRAGCAWTQRARS